jgi:GTP pyrophosphokinase
MQWSDLEREIKGYMAADKIESVQRAYQVAEEAHRLQKRITGEPYIVHPLSVAQILAESKLDATSIAAALLHDTLEDTELTYDQLQVRFGADVAQIVDGVTKLEKLDFSNLLEHQTENYRKMFLAMAKDMRVILIKLADRLHNMRTLKVHQLEKQKSIAKETMDIYAPLAGRLGINSMKWELEDLAFRYLKPEMYFKIATFVRKKREERESVVQSAATLLREKLASEGVQAEVYGRAKHFYSIYRKMEEKNLNFDEIYDVLAIRILVHTVRECYDVLGLVHSEWRPILGRFKDYIAMPKSNQYQSLHTTVAIDSSDPLEIQIRTHEMHEIAEFGIAAHWIYKEKGKARKNEDVQKMQWLRQILELQNQTSGASEYMEELQKNILVDEVFVFTPKGDLFEMPADATPIDFAYRVHTDVGHRCIGAKINGRIVQLNATLENGDVVEIITSKQANGPSRDWLNIAKTASARSRIRQWFKRLNREESILKGSELFERELKKQLVKEEHLLIEGMKNLPFEVVFKEFNLLNQQDLLAAIGYADLSPQVVVHRLLEELKKKLPDKPLPDAQELLDNIQIGSRKKEAAGIIIDDIDNIAVKLARCCNPIPGDPIIGYVTRGRGVSIHHRDCTNVVMVQEQGRLLPAKWGTKSVGPFVVALTVTALDYDGLLQQLLLSITESKTSLVQIKARTNKSGLALVDLHIEVKDKEHMDSTLDKLRKVRDVYHVEQMTHKRA